MIKLDLPRDEKGRLVLSRGFLQGFDAAELLSKEGQFFARFKDWIKSPDGKRVLVKFRDEEFVPLYKSDIFAEVIFQAFASAAKFDCANVDVGLFNGTDVLLSEHIAADGDNIISFGGINASLGEFAMGEDYSLDGVLNIVGEFARRANLKVAENLREELLKLMLVDFLTFQQDRHDENIVFVVHDNTISLAPAIDNEKCFLIDRIAVFLNSLDVLDGRVYKRSLEPEGQTDSEVVRCFEDVKNATKIFGLPILTVKVHSITEAPDELFDEEPYDEHNEFRSNNAMMTLYAEDLAREIKNSTALKEFYQGIRFDLFELVKTQEKVVGYEVPNIYARFAEDILQKQKRRLDRAFLKIEEEEEEK